MNRVVKLLLGRLLGGDLKRLIAQNRVPDQVISMRRLKKLGFSPDLIFDVGAYHGEFASTCFEIWPETRIVLFEALKTKIPLLGQKFKGKNVQIVEGIVGAAIQDDITYFADETASSVLQSEEVYHAKQVVQQKMITLDSYINNSGLKAPNFLKIDTQGYEYPILQGMGRNLADVEVILLELNFIEVYYHVKLAHEVIALLSDYNFVIYDICEIHRRPLDQALFQIDFIFVKKDSFLRSDKKWDVKKI